MIECLRILNLLHNQSEDGGGLLLVEFGGADRVDCF